MFADWIFFGSTAAALFVLRQRDRISGAPALMKVPGHPYTTLIFITAAAYVVIGSIISNPANAVRGAGLLALGVPVYLFWNARRPSSRPPIAS